MKLENKSAIVTGAGRGLGRAIAIAMSREGALTTIMSRSLDELKSVDRSIKDRGGENLVVQGDVSRPDDAKRLVDEALKCFERVVDLEPGNPEGYNNLGYIYEKMDRFGCAKQTYEQALHLDQNNVEAMINIAQVLELEGDYYGAEQLQTAH